MAVLGLTFKANGVEWSFVAGALNTFYLEGTESPSQTGGVGTGEDRAEGIVDGSARIATSMVATPSRTALQVFCDTCPFVMAAPTWDGTTSER